jgi:hypothetical protein
MVLLLLASSASLLHSSHTVHGCCQMIVLRDGKDAQPSYCMCRNFRLDPHGRHVHARRWLCSVILLLLLFSATSSAGEAATKLFDTDVWVVYDKPAALPAASFSVPGRMHLSALCLPAHGG